METKLRILALGDRRHLDGPSASKTLVPAYAVAVGIFGCQGELAQGIKRVRSIMPDPKLRLWAKLDDSQGQPDATRLERARAFAGDMPKAVSQVAQEGKGIEP